MIKWAIGDTHFDHEKIIEYCDRPFSSAEEMNEIMIANWNSVVDNEDIVYHFGDFSCGKGSRHNIAQIRARLNGHIFLLKGNHDRESKSWYNRAGFEFVVGGEYWVYASDILLSHRPYPIKNPLFNIHAHTHNLMHLTETKLYFSVSVEQINYTPINLDELVEKLRKDRYAS